MDRQRHEVDINYDAFVRQLAAMLQDHRDEFALMRNGKVVGWFRSVDEAGAEGDRSFADGIYSIQEVTDEPIDLGIFSHV